MDFNRYEEVAIFDDMELHRKFPDNLFVASDTTKLALTMAIERTGSGR